MRFRFFIDSLAKNWRLKAASFAVAFFLWALVRLGTSDQLTDLGSNSGDVVDTLDFLYTTAHLTSDDFFTKITSSHQVSYG